MLKNFGHEIQGLKSWILGHSNYQFQKASLQVSDVLPNTSQMTLFLSHPVKLSDSFDKITATDPQPGRCDLYCRMEAEAQAELEGIIGIFIQ